MLRYRPGPIIRLGRQSAKYDVTCLTGKVMTQMVASDQAKPTESNISLPTHTVVGLLWK